MKLLLNNALILSFPEVAGVGEGVGGGDLGLMWGIMEILWGLYSKWESFVLWGGAKWGLTTQLYLTPEKNAGTSSKVRDWEQVVF